MRAVQGWNKWRYGSSCCIKLGFMVSLSILRCGSSIIKFLGEVRTLGILTVREKLACNDDIDWPDRSEGPNKTRRDEVRLGGSTVSGNGSGAPPLDVELRQEGVGSGGCHQLPWCCRGHGLFVPVQQSNHNTLNRNLTFQIVQDIKKITYNTIVL